MRTKPTYKTSKIILIQNPPEKVKKQPNTNKIKILYQNLYKCDYNNMETLHQIYLESFKSPYAKYQLFSMFATDIYTGICLEQSTK